MLKKIVMILAACLVTMSFSACEKERIKSVEKCEMCGVNEADITTRGTMFDDNDAHHLCNNCWNSYKSQNNVQEGMEFDY